MAGTVRPHNQALSVHQVKATDADVARLIDAHKAAAALHYEPEDCHAADADDLDSGGAVMFAARHNGETVAIGGYHPIGDTVAEVKSVFAAPSARGLGAGRAVVQHIIAHASAAGFRHLMLEAGTDAYAAPARALYASLGFQQRPPFGSYVAAQASTFIERQL